MKPRFTEEQIIPILKEYEAGKKASEIAHDYGISEQTFYRWKNKFVSMDVGGAKRLSQLERENRKLESRNALLSIENLMLKDMLQKSS